MLEDSAQSTRWNDAVEALNPILAVECRGHAAFLTGARSAPIQFPAQNTASAAAHLGASFASFLRVLSAEIFPTHKGAPS